MDSPIKWKPIPGFSGYFAGHDGSIWSTRQGTRILSPDVRPIDGRKRYTLRHDNGTYVRKYGSYFVLIAYTGPKPTWCEACHNDGDCTNDSPANLRWDSSAANKADMRAHGTARVGADHPKAKLTDDQVASLILDRSCGDSLSVLSERYGVSASRVSQICIKGAR